MDTVIHKARAFLQSSQEQKALELLAPEISLHPDDVQLLQVFGEALLEANDVETAYTVLSKATELDPEAKLGVEKFLYLGQIIGGADGCALLNTAILRLQDQLQTVHENKDGDDAVLKELAKLYTTSEMLALYLIKKLNQAIFAEIEIWMTDLCMEPEAEAECDKLISHSLALDNTNPEAYSLLALIRISQQRQAEAEEALNKAWELFAQEKQELEAQQNQEGEESSFEYIELVQPLLGLARFAIELGLYDVVPQITNAVSEVNDNALDCFYYEALAHSLKAKQIYAGLHPSEDDYRDIDDAVIIKSDEESIQSCVSDVKSALTQGYRVINSADLEASDPEVVDQVNTMLSTYGGPVMADLMPPRRSAVDEEDVNWEEEILSDEN